MYCTSYKRLMKAGEKKNPGCTWTSLLICQCNTVKFQFDYNDSIAVISLRKNVLFTSPEDTASAPSWLFVTRKWVTIISDRCAKLHLTFLSPWNLIQVCWNCLSVDFGERGHIVPGSIMNWVANRLKTTSLTHHCILNTVKWTTQLYLPSTGTDVMGISVSTCRTVHISVLVSFTKKWLPGRPVRHERGLT